MCDSSVIRAISYDISDITVTSLYVVGWYDKIHVVLAG